MTDNYEQNVEIDLPKGARYKQFGGLLLILLSLGFIMLGVFFSYYFFIGAGILLVAGVAVTHVYNKTVLKYTYSYNNERIVFITTSVIGRTEKNISVLWEDVDEYGDFLDLVEARDFIMCANPREYGIKALTFHLENGEMHRILFAPDDYMKALIDENYKYNIGAKR